LAKNRFIRRGTETHPEPKLGRMLIVSLVVHLAVLAVFTGVFEPRLAKPPRAYYVDLVNLPVADPQAGRPDVRPKAEKPRKAPEPPKAEVKPPEPPKPPPKKPEPVKVAKPEPVKPKVAKPKPKPVPKAKPAPKAKPKPKPEVAKPSQSYEEDTLAAIKKMQAKKEIEELKQKLAALSASDTRQAPAVPDAPVGMPEGSGTEAGTSYDAWIHDYLKQAWLLSKYQVPSRDLEATVALVFDPQGKLLDYRFLEHSGEARFDDSVKRAVLQLKQLPKAPGRRLEREVVFNLKELLE